METSSTGGSHGISFDFPWYSLNLFARLYTFFSLQKSKESQATHAPSKPKRSVSILLGITTKVFKSPMSGGVSNVWLDTLHDHSTIQHAFNCIYCIYCIDCSFYIPTYFLYIYIYIICMHMLFTRPTGFLWGNDSLVDGCWDEQLSDCSETFRRLTPFNSHRSAKPFSPWSVLAITAF